MARADADIIAELEGNDDVPWDQYFVLGDFLVGFEQPTQGLMAKIIEDDILAAEVVDFLRRNGKTREK
jgi:hypothetical protein